MFELKVETPEVQINENTVIPQEEKTQKRLSLSLSGMHCTSCSLIIEKSLNKVPGVKEAHVNFAAEKALVTFDESSVKKNHFLRQ